MVHKAVQSTKHPKPQLGKGIITRQTLRNLSNKHEFLSSQLHTKKIYFFVMSYTFYRAHCIRGISKCYRRKGVTIKLTQHVSVDLLKTILP